jgi:hypothetical protein
MAKLASSILATYAALAAAKDSDFLWGSATASYQGMN